MKKVPLRIIDKDFNLIGEIDDYESLIFIRRFFRVGEFEIHISLDKQNADKLIEDNLILLGADTRKVGIIEHCEKDTNEQGQDVLIVKGPTLKGITKRRITVPDNTTGYDRIKGNAETVMKYYVNNNIVTPADILRKIAQVALATDNKRGIVVPWQTRYEGLDDILGQIAEFTKLGWDITLDLQNNKWLFDIVEGRNLTSDQDILPPVIFSLDFDNIKTKHLMKSFMDYKNVGYCGGKGEEENRLIQQVGSISGIDRREVFIDCSDAENVDELTANGQQKLDEFKKIESFEAQILPQGSFVYGKDYDLGDTVTVMDRKWGVILNSMITEIKEIYEINGFNLETTFGTTIPNILTKFKRETKKIVR